MRKPRYFHPDHPTIIAILAAVDSEPGIQPATVMQRINGSGGSSVNTRYHIRRLVSMSLIREAREGKTIFLFPKDWTPTRREAYVRDHLTPGQRAVLDIVQRAPGSNYARIAEALDVESATVSWYVRRLEQRAKVRVVRTYKENNVFPT